MAGQLPRFLRIPRKGRAAGRHAPPRELRRRHFKLAPRASSQPFAPRKIVRGRHSGHEGARRAQTRGPGLPPRTRPCPRAPWPPGICTGTAELVSGFRPVQKAILTIEPSNGTRPPLRVASLYQPVSACTSDWHCPPPQPRLLGGLLAVCHWAVSDP